MILLVARGAVQSSGTAPGKVLGSSSDPVARLPDALEASLRRGAHLHTHLAPHPTYIAVCIPTPTSRLVATLTLRSAHRARVLHTMQHAVWQGDVELAISCMVQHQVDLDALNYEGFSYLHIATHREHLQMVRFLLSKGARVDVLSQAGDTPLCMAARDGQRDVAVALMMAKPKPNLELENAMGRRPLELAIMHRRVRGSPSRAAVEWRGAQDRPNGFGGGFFLSQTCPAGWATVGGPRIV